MVNNADWLCDLKYIDFMREIGSKFTHTYTATSTTSTTESISIGFSTAGPTGGYTYTANSSTVNLTWDRYTDNAFIIKSY